MLVEPSDRRDYSCQPLVADGIPPGSNICVSGYAASTIEDLSGVIVDKLQLSIFEPEFRSCA